MLSHDIENIAEWVKLWVNDDMVRNALIGRLNAAAADAHALEGCVIPHHARPIEEVGNVVCLARRRPAVALPCDSEPREER